MPTIYSICRSATPSDEAQAPFHYSRERLSSANLIAKHGIEGDLKAGKNPKRNLNIMCFDTLQRYADEGYQVAPGEMGEQLILQGIDVTNLQIGDRLQLGDEAIIEVTLPRTGCDWFEKVQGLPKKANDGSMGMMATVVVGGRIAEGDAVKLLEGVR